MWGRRDHRRDAGAPDRYEVVRGFNDHAPSCRETVPFGGHQQQMHGSEEAYVGAC